MLVGDVREGEGGYILHGIVSADAYEYLFEGNRPICCIEAKESRLRIYSQKLRHIFIVGQCCRQSHNTNHTLCTFNL